MKTKIVSLFDINLKSLIEPLENKVVVGGYPMWYRYNETEIAKIPEFGKLTEKLNNNGDPYRWIHTEYMLQSLYLIANPDNKASYQKFIEGRGNGLDPYLSLNQFDDLRALVFQTLKDSKDFKFMERLIATHDVGCIYGEARHFVRSGAMSVDIFKQLGFSDDMAEMAGLINGNHSLLGDILLGEGTPDFAIKVYRKMSDLSVKMGKSIDYGWRLLFILNAIDVDAAYRGFLTQSKFQELQTVRDFSHLLELDAVWENHRKVLLGLPAESETVDWFKDLYLQYCYDRIREMDTDDAYKLLNTLSVLDYRLKQEVPGKFFCITFKSGKLHDLSLMKEFVDKEFAYDYNKEHEPFLREDGNLVLFQGVVNGLPFQIMSDGYLEINDTNQ